MLFFFKLDALQFFFTKFYKLNQPPSKVQTPKNIFNGFNFAEREKIHEKCFLRLFFFLEPYFNFNFIFYYFFQKKNFVSSLSNSSKLKSSLIKIGWVVPEINSEQTAGVTRRRFWHTLLTTNSLRSLRE